ncbi:MAG: SDR family NAD(P)-dependent oxidoreductase [Clostridia bacterium]|nr:SDR family NAD(P)-dependent oxidoreductase [Clostridia bacterium]
MKQNVLITGTGREMALGFNFVRRYLEQGDTVFACVRKPSEALEKLQEQYPAALHILTMDIGSTESVNAAAEKAAQLVPYLDLLINNAVTTSPDTNKELEDFDLDTVMPALNVATVGPLRVIKAFLPLMRKSEGTALIVNISSEAGSIGACYRTTYIDYGMAKAALNMATKTLHNKFKDDPRMNIICVHPGWMRTNPGNAKAPFDPYEHAETMRLMFEAKRHDKEGPVFVTYAGEEYPW